MSEHANSELALFVATTVAVVTAILVGAILYLPWNWFRRRSGMRVLSYLLASILVSLTYVLSVGVLFYVADRQVNPPVPGFREFGVGYTFIHPGLLHKLLPLAATVLTWLLLGQRSRRQAIPVREPVN